MTTLSITYVIRLRKGDEWYVVIYTKKEHLNAVRTLWRWCKDKTLAFDWSDAIAMGQQMKLARTCMKGVRDEL